MIKTETIPQQLAYHSSHRIHCIFQNKSLLMNFFSFQLNKNMEIIFLILSTSNQYNVKKYKICALNSSVSTRDGLMSWYFQRWLQHTTLIPITERKKQSSLCGQPGLHSQFQTSQGYIIIIPKKEWLCLFSFLTNLKRYFVIFIKQN